MNTRTRVRLVAIAGGIVALAAAIAAGTALTEDVRPVRPGSRAPDFRAVDVFSGDTLSLSDYEGDVVLLNLWATWCAPCEAEMPSMQKLHEQLAPMGLKVVAVSVDEKPTEHVARWVEERGLTFDVLHDREGEIAVAYQATGWPESFIIDQHGVIVRKIWGPAEWDDPAEIAVFQRLLGISNSDHEG